MAVHLEIPIFGPDSAAAAVGAGASRLELNAAGSYPEGGLTPSLDELAEVTKLGLAVPIRIMIRPRGPPARTPARPEMDFLYSEPEICAMEAAIQEIVKHGNLCLERGDGVVFGCLSRRTAEQGDEGGTGEVIVDPVACGRLVRAAKPYKVVFHRAFDEIVGADSSEGRAGHQWQEALVELERLGFDGILTSGGPGNASQNIRMLKEIVESAGARLQIIVGGGVRSTNTRELMRVLDLSIEREPSQAAWLHSSCLTTKNAEIVDSQEVKGILHALR